MESYRAFLRTLVELDLHTQITPIQLAIRLLIPEGSLLLELAEIRKLVGLFDARALYYPWQQSPTQRWMRFAGRFRRRSSGRKSGGRRVRRSSGRSGTLRRNGEFPDIPLASRATIPYLTEPWYC